MKNFFSILSCCVFLSTLSANVGPQGFGEFCQNYFIETGTFGGEGIQLALNAGFKKARSIESDVTSFKHSKERFRNNPNVEIYCGNSSVDLWEMIEDIDEPVTFWLDAHHCPPREDGGKNCPLIEELEQIKQHPIKTHIILIDDMHCCNTILFDFMGREDFIKKLLEINPEYEIRYVDGGNEGEYKNNIMVAAPRA